MAAPRKTRASVTKIVEYSEGVRLFRIKPEKKVKKKYRAGQFLHLTLEEYDPSFNWPESRVFSIATAPERANELDIIVSRQGKYTTRMFNELEIGSEVWLKLPFGDFNFKESTGKSNILIAGGTGISPFIPFLQQAIDNEEQPCIDLYYGVRNDDVIIIEDLLKECINKLKNFNFQLFIEEPLAKTNFDYLQGQLAIDEIVNKHKEDKNAVYYISGPQALIKNIERALLENNISPGNIHYDEWE